MPKFDVEIEGRRRRPPKPGRGPFSLLLMLLRRVLAQPLLLIAGGLALFVYFVGTPHVGGTYTCNGPLRSGGGCKFSYRSCVYYGVQGRQIVYPEPDEQCEVVQFLPVIWGPENTASGKK